MASPTLFLGHILELSLKHNVEFDVIIVTVAFTAETPRRQ